MTLPLEIKHVWGRKLCLSTFLYISCRYALLGNVLFLLASAGKLEQGCDTWYKIISALSVLGRAAVIVTLTGRTAALYTLNRCALRRYAFIYLCTLGAVCVGLDIAHIPTNTCDGDTGVAITHLLLHILVVVFESSAAILTIAHMIRTKEYGPLGKRESRRRLIAVVLEQDVLYFSIISIFTTATVVLNVEAPAGFIQRMLNAFTLPLSCLLVARFLLHIRAWEEKQQFLVDNSNTQIDHAPSRVAFRTIGSITTFRAVAGDMLTSVVDQFADKPDLEVHQRWNGGYDIDY